MKSNYKRNNIMVSVLIVTYNAEKFIENTIKSCINQTYTNLEILILDNNSRDETVNILENIDDNRIKLYKNQANLGAYKRLNFLLDKAKGKYIAIQDHDDIWLPQKIKKQVTFLESHKTYIGCGTWTYFYYEARQCLVEITSPQKTEIVNHTSLMFQNGPYRYDLSFVLTDEHFQKKILSRHGTLGCIQEPLTVHRIRNDNKNLSITRFTVNKKNIVDFFYINGYNLSSFLYMVDLLVGRFFPHSIRWIIRRKILLRHYRWISKNEFKKIILPYACRAIIDESKYQ